MELRPARSADVPAIAAIWHPGWLDAHLGNVPDELVAVRTDESFHTRAAEMVDHTVVALLDGAIAGFVVVEGDEVEQVYVDAAARGSGVAAALLAEAERVVSAGGHAKAWLAVAPGNMRARRFYEKQGWVDEGWFEHQAPGPDGPVPVPCQRYTKGVSPHG